jgi:hypothetical protein
MATPTTIHFADALTLDGWTLHDRCRADGRDLSVTLQWRAARVMDTSYTVFVHAVGPDGQILGQRDRLPRDGEQPTTAWRAGEYVLDTYDLGLPRAARAGPLRLIAGWYDPRSGDRLAPAPGPAAGPTYAVLAEALPACG